MTGYIADHDTDFFWICIIKTQKIVITATGLIAICDVGCDIQSFNFRGRPGKQRLLNFRMEMEFVEQLKRIYGHCKRIAKTVLPEGLAGRSE